MNLMKYGTKQPRATAGGGHIKTHTGTQMHRKGRKTSSRTNNHSDIEAASEYRGGSEVYIQWGNGSIAKKKDKKDKKHAVRALSDPSKESKNETGTASSARDFKFKQKALKSRTTLALNTQVSASRQTHADTDRCERHEASCEENLSCLNSRRNIIRVISAVKFPIS